MDRGRDLHKNSRIAGVSLQNKSGFINFKEILKQNGSIPIDNDFTYHADQETEEPEKGLDMGAMTCNCQRCKDKLRSSELIENMACGRKMTTRYIKE